jgi:opacity protein-like surface antigen
MRRSSLDRFLVVLILANGLLAAQSKSAAGSGEVTAFGGVVAGIGTHGTVGGGLGYALTERIMAVGEFGYIPGGGEKFTIVGVTAKTSSKAFNFNGSIHYQFPVRQDGFVPYVGGGIGAVHSSASSTAGCPGAWVSVKGSATNFYLNFGGGLRYYVTDRWGYAPN